MKIMRFIKRFSIIFAAIVAGFMTFMFSAIIQREANKKNIETYLGVSRDGEDYTIRSRYSEIGLREIGTDSDHDGTRDLWGADAKVGTEVELQYIVGSEFMASVGLGDPHSNRIMVLYDDDADTKADRLVFISGAVGGRFENWIYHDLDLNGLVDWLQGKNSDGTQQSYILKNFEFLPAELVNLKERIFDIPVSETQTQRVQLIEGEWVTLLDLEK